MSAVDFFDLLEGGDAESGTHPVAKPYRKIGNRMSLLSVSRFCSLAAVLSNQHGAGRAAAMSTAFHAKAGGQPDAEQKWLGLDEEEQAEVLSWAMPETVEIAEGVTLDYASAIKEAEVSLEAPDGTVTVGHVDMYWIREVNGQKVAYVGDIKKSSWTTLDGPTALQLMAYCLGVSDLHQCDAFVPGLWIPTEGRWMWHTAIIQADDPGTQRIRDVVMAAARNTEGNVTTGQHCRDCYGRLHCPEHVLPAAAASTWLAPVAEGQQLTPETARDCLLACEAASEVIDAAHKQIKEWVRRGGVIQDPTTHKVWKAIEVQGRKSLDKDALVKRVGLDVVEECMSRGKPFPQFRWLKP